MIRLHNDYNRGACGKILEKLAQINGESYDGYGEDTWCEKAAKLIREKCKAPEAAIHFLPGATQANFIVPLKIPAISWCHFRPQAERSAQSRSVKQQPLIIMAGNQIISANPRWCIFHSLQSGEPFIQSRN